MELRHLRYFVATAEEMSFARAADRLNVSHPAVSVQVRQLEGLAGVKLLSVQGRKLTLTKAGEIFLVQARKTLVEAARAIILAQQADCGEIGNLAIGHCGPAEVHVLPSIVPTFKRHWPQVHLSFRSLNAPQQLEGLRRGELDLAFVALPLPTEEFDTCALVTEPMVAVVPERHLLAQRATISVKDLSREPLIMFPRSVDPEAYRRIEQLFLNCGAVMNIAYELETPQSVMSFVAMELGCSILPCFMWNFQQHGIIHRPLDPIQPGITLGIAKRKDSCPIANNFYHLTIDNIPQFGSSLRTDRLADR